jgi:lipid-A-disaccharide synthase
MTGLRVGMVAGEVSGDLLAGLMLTGLKRRWPDLQAYGIGGPQMAAQGFEALWPHDKLAVRGYVEVLRHYREIVGIRRQLRDRLLADRPPLFVGVDAPDFNLDLEADLKARGMRTVHFVCPSIWAWRAGRIDQIRRSVDHVLCLFPFEPALLARHGIAATYVGHPLADVISAQADRAAARRALGLDEGDEVLAVLPGSRASEIRYLADVFFAAALRVQRARPGLKIIVPALPSLRVAIESAAARAGLGIAGAGGAGGLQILAGQSHQALAACDLTLIASGTATLEAALFKRPMVIAYRMNAISWQIMKRQALQPWVGLPNILLQDMAVPELLQSEATPERLARAVLDWLEAPAKMAAVQQRFAQLHTDLRRDTPTLATDAIAQVLQA